MRNAPRLWLLAHSRSQAKLDGTVRPSRVERSDPKERSAEDSPDEYALGHEASGCKTLANQLQAGSCILRELRTAGAVTTRNSID